MESKDSVNLLVYDYLKANIGDKIANMFKKDAKVSQELTKLLWDYLLWLIRFVNFAGNSNLLGFV